jgi:hypothetical protein
MSYLERAIADGHVKLTGDGEHARLGRRWLRLAAGRLRAMRETGFETVPRGFPRGRGKLRPYRARSRLPRQYGKPEEYRFYQGAPNNDIQPVSKEALIGAIKKCHQTLWAGGKLSPLTAL